MTQQRRVTRVSSHFVRFLFLNFFLKTLNVATVSQATKRCTVSHIGIRHNTPHYLNYLFVSIIVASSVASPYRYVTEPKTELASHE
jgi:hypothetical protein